MLTRLSDVLLVLIPIASSYVLMGFIFAYNVGRRSMDIPDAIFFPCFVLPGITLGVAQMGLLLYFAYDHGEMLIGQRYNAATASVETAIGALIWLEIFMSFARAVSKAIDAAPAHKV